MECTNKQHGYAWACDEQHHGHEARTYNMYTNDSSELKKKLQLLGLRNTNKRPHLIFCLCSLLFHSDFSFYFASLRFASFQSACLFHFRFASEIYNFALKRNKWNKPLCFTFKQKGISYRFRFNRKRTELPILGCVK
jgi:hypothetical protein